MDRQYDSAMEEDPIFWTSTRPGYNDRDRERVYMKAGRRVREKIPQTGHIGEPRSKRKAPGLRFLYMIRHDGHEGAIVLTNAAAHLDPNTGWGQYQLMKARFLGWFASGDCPAALLGTGRLKPDHIVNKSIIGQLPCEQGTYDRDNPCKHTKLEQAARREQNAEDDRVMAIQYKDQGQKMLEAQAEQTKQIIEANRQGMRELAEAIRGQPLPPPPGPKAPSALELAKLSDEQPAAVEVEPEVSADEPEDLGQDSDPDLTAAAPQPEVPAPRRRGRPRKES